MNRSRNGGKHIVLLLLLFGGACLVYGWVALQMGSTRSGRVDESIYINMARAFYYDRNFMRGGAAMGYDCILYSILLSPCYRFYSPDGILQLMRVTGVITMSSAVFPAYLLSARILGNKRAALFGGFLSVLIPSMTLSYYMYQEVLLYPLTLWFCYFLYRTSNLMKYRYQAIAGIFLYLLYSTKTICIYILGAYLLYLILGCFVFRKSFQWTAISILLILGVFGALYMAVRLGIESLNGFDETISHYDTQILGSLRLLLHQPRIYIPQMLRGIVFYLYYTLMSVLVLPIILPVVGWGTLSDEDKRLTLFALLCIAVAIVLIVGGIFLLEDADSTTPRFHSRYYFSFFIPLILVSIKALPTNRRLCLIAMIGSAMLFLYPFLATDGLLFFSSFVDNYLFSLFESVNLFFPQKGKIMLFFAFAVYGLGFVWLFAKMQKKQLPRRTLPIIFALYFLVLNVGNNGVIFMYRATSEMEQQIDADCTRLASYLEGREEYSAYIDLDGVYCRSINYNTQLNKDYFYYQWSEVENRSLVLDHRVAYVIIPDEIDAIPQNCTEIALGLKTASIYHTDPGSTITFD